MNIHIVIDPGAFNSLGRPQDPSQILHHSSAEADRCGEKECRQRRTVEPFSDQLPGGDDYPRLTGLRSLDHLPTLVRGQVAGEQFRFDMMDVFKQQTQVVTMCLTVG